MNKKNSPQRKTTLKWNSNGELSEIDMLRILEKISSPEAVATGPGPTRRERPGHLNKLKLSRRENLTRL